MRLSVVSLSTSMGSSGVASVFFVGLVNSSVIWRGMREPGAVGDDFGVEAEAAVLVAEPFGDAAAGFGAGQVRLAGEVAEIGFGARGVGNGAQFLFELRVRRRRAQARIR